MPLGERLEIRSEPPLTFDEEMDIMPDREIQGVIWKIFWNEVPLPWYTQTKLQAMAIAFGCQYGAIEAHNHTERKRRSDD
jgi:hypothetical protein